MVVSSLQEKEKEGESGEQGGGVGCVGGVKVDTRDQRAPTLNLLFFLVSMCADFLAASIQY